MGASLYSGSLLGVSVARTQGMSGEATVGHTHMSKHSFNECRVLP